MVKNILDLMFCRYIGGALLNLYGIVVSSNTGHFCISLFRSFPSSSNMDVESLKRENNMLRKKLEESNIEIVETRYKLEAEKGELLTR